MTVNLYTVPADATGTILTNGSATVVTQQRCPARTSVYSFTGTP